MSVLTGQEILKQVAAGLISITPFEPKNVSENSFDLRLADELVVYMTPDGECLHDVYNRAIKMFPQDGTTQSHMELRSYLQSKGALLDMHTSTNKHSIKMDDSGYMLLPNRTYLARTIERVESDHFVPQLHGRSSCGRLFISIHQTAGWGDVGFQGTWTLEITCELPVVVYPGTRIAQITFETVIGDKTLYRENKNSKYNDQEQPEGSLFWVDKGLDKE